MSNLHLDASNLQDGIHIDGVCLGQSVKNIPSAHGTLPQHLFCHQPGCGHLIFNSEVQHRNHILTHITLPRVVLQRLDNATVEKATQQSTPKHEPLKVRLKLTTSAGSNKPAFEAFLASELERNLKASAEQKSEVLFYNLMYQRNSHCVEVVRESSTYLPRPGGLFCLSSVDKEVNTELLPKNTSSQSVWSSPGRPKAKIELEDPTVSASLEEDSVEDTEQEGDPFEGEDDSGSNFEDEDGGEEHNNQHEERPERTTDSNTIPSTAPPSPTPSEVQRPHGYLAPDQLVDEDSCYPHSPPVSPARMVEMNGSTSAVSGSDNDSGHSRSPAPFTGAGAVGEDDSSAPINWDELVSNSIGHDSSDSAASNDNGQSHVSPAGNVGDVSSDAMAANILDPLLLPGAASSAEAEGEQDNLNLLHGLAADAVPSEADRVADTEYMSLDRLGEAAMALACDVCGERAQDRRGLEEHRTLAGHFKCLAAPECGAVVWPTAAELAAHQTSMHGVQPARGSPQTQGHASTPQTSPHAPGTPPVQQLAQQVQRLPVPQGAYPPPSMPGGQYPQQMQQQMGAMMPQMMAGQMPPQRRPPAGYRMPMPMPGQQTFAPSQQQPSFQGGGIQPRPLNTMVAQQPPRGAVPQGRMPPAGALMAGRGGMGPMPSMRGQKRAGPHGAGRGGGMGPGAKQRRVEGMPPPQSDGGGGKKSDASAVANILATRGITVTPAAGGPGGPVRGAAQPAPQGRQRQTMLAPAPPPPVTTLNLNSAISIIPTSVAGNGRQQQQNNAGFAVPQVRALGRQPMTMSVDRPPRPPTVDLTGDGPVPQPGSTRLQMGPGPAYHRGRGRPSNVSRTTCQICDKMFASPEVLQQHMLMHRGPGKLPFRCNLCNAQYPTSQGLQQHRQTYHKEAIGMGGPPLAPGEEMVIPLIDLKQPGVAARLGSLGIHHCIPLSGLGNQSNGYFSLPVVSIDGSRPGAAGNLRSLGASGVLSIGPIKLVPK